MPLMLLDVADEAAIKELRQIPGVKILWIEEAPAPDAVPFDSSEFPLLVVQPLSEQAGKLLRTLEELGVLQILKGRANP